MTKPNEVLEAMEIAVSDCFKEHFDRGVAPEIDAIIKAALSAARELGWKLVPREITDEMFDAGLRAHLSDKWQWKPQYDAAPDILAEGE